MMRIFKYPLPGRGEHTIKMFRPATVLSVITQFDRPTIYATVAEDVEMNPDRDVVTKKFRVCATGHDSVDEKDKFIGTVVDGELNVWHVFEVLEK